jgi:hypothetical protein
MNETENLFYEEDPFTGELINIQKTIYSYNADNLLTESVIYVLDEEDNWSIEEKRSMVYDSEARLIKKTNHSTSSYGKDFIETYEYIEDGDSLTQIRNWETSSEINVFHYDTNGNPTIINNYTSNSGFDIISGYTLMSYNTSVYVENLLYKGFEDKNGNILEKFEKYSIDGNTPILIDSEQYYYSEIQLPLLDTSPYPFAALYPNPCRNSISSNTRGILEIKNYTGTSLIITHADKDKLIEIGTLPAGVYYYTIITQQGTKSGTLIKE